MFCQFVAKLVCLERTEERRGRARRRRYNSVGWGDKISRCARMEQEEERMKVVGLLESALIDGERNTER